MSTERVAARREALIAHLDTQPHNATAWLFPHKPIDWCEGYLFSGIVLEIENSDRTDF